MDSLRELIELLDKRDDGMSLSELKSIFEDVTEIKNFIKAGLDNGSIIKEGEKRGTRYFSTTPKMKNALGNDEDEAIVHYGLEQYLKSDKPITGQAVVTKVTAFGPYKKNGSIIEFLNSGNTVESFLVAYNKHTKKNEVVHSDKITRYNKIMLKYEDRSFSFIKVYAKDLKKEVENFKIYDDFREHIRLSLCLI